MRTPKSKYALRIASRDFTGCMKASVTSLKRSAICRTSASEATSNQRNPDAWSVSITHGEGFAFTA